ncbi:ribonuclease HI family protein [Tuberibacillus sp. Marseille-P3662]|uniref:ribonuclease HI family protein n=1 Tax=Tuberibacillus sp. Marseille-P3662 TaxID=1965358 RepID=UPI000A1CB8AB|nr:ribonuclease HI family protein [Tuberibacillus sp. Marseille-P3662]
MIDVFVDGASAGDPGPSGAGIFIKHSNGTVETYSVYLSDFDHNHTAEFKASIKALNICLEKGYKSVALKTDSQLVDDAFNRRFVKKQTYKPLLNQLLQLAADFDLVFMKWIPGKANNQADYLAKQAIHQRSDGED